MKIEFSELHEGAHVELKHPKKLSWKEQKAITVAFKDEDISSQLDVAERLAIALIKKGYILDADDKPVEFPLTEETVGNVPAVVIEEVTKKFAEIKSEATGKNS